MNYNKDLVPNYKGMEYTREQLKELFEEAFIHVPQRRVKMYTGLEGMDRFEELVENRIGLRRVYLGRKIPRILNRLNFKIKKSHRDIYYKLVK